jgi:hypothetical protein
MKRWKMWVSFLIGEWLVNWPITVNKWPFNTLFNRLSDVCGAISNKARTLGPGSKIEFHISVQTASCCMQGLLEVKRQL